MYSLVSQRHATRTSWRISNLTLKGAADLRVISQARDSQVAFGSKRTSSGRQDPLAHSLMTQAVWKRLSSPQKLQRMGVVHVDVTV